MTQLKTFDPATITVPVGTTVVWTNTSTNLQHTTTSDDGGATWDSGILDPNGVGTFPFTFTTAGTYNYHCNVHPGMVGSVIVQDLTPTTTNTPTSTSSPNPTASPTITLTPNGSVTAAPTLTSTPSPIATRFVYLPAIFNGSGATTALPTPSSQSVSVVDFSYQPNPVTVPVGTTMIWTNNTSASTPHTVTSDDGTTFDSGTLNASQQFTFTFNTPGTYNYHCKFHQTLGMVGSIMVTSGPAAASW
jgi:plastocyanin